MLAKGLLSALVACHAIDLVIHTLTRCVSAIHKQLPARQDYSATVICTKIKSNNFLCKQHSRCNLKSYQGSL